MAMFKSAFVKVLNYAHASPGITMPVADLPTAMRLSNLSTSSISSVVQSVGGGDWVAPGDGFLLLTCDGEMDVAAGEAPVAGASFGIPLAPGSQIWMSIRAGQKLAVVDAAA